MVLGNFAKQRKPNGNAITKYKGFNYVLLNILPTPNKMRFSLLG